MRPPLFFKQRRSRPGMERMRLVTSTAGVARSSRTARAWKSSKLSRLSGRELCRAFAGRSAFAPARRVSTYGSPRAPGTLNPGRQRARQAPTAPPPCQGTTLRVRKPPTALLRATEGPREPTCAVDNWLAPLQAGSTPARAAAVLPPPPGSLTRALRGCGGRRRNSVLAGPLTVSA